MVISSNGRYDWAKEVKFFDETKAGVKGLVDAGVTELPRLFVHQPEDLHHHPPHAGNLELPTVDFSGAAGPRRREVVEEMGKAAAEWGFFRIVNHGIPIETMDAMLEGVKRFHELPPEEKAPFYSSDDPRRTVKLNSSLPIRENDPASWRDILACQFKDDQIDLLQIPSTCRKEMMEYVKHVIELRETMAELLSEALGLPSDHLSKMECMKSQSLACLYYPICPEPQKTLGTPKHSDVSFLTLLLQDSTGGLQVLHDGRWVNVDPVRGAFVANIGDLMQIISNGKFISVQHRVVAQAVGPRVSVAAFIGSSMRAMTRAFGPIEELLSRRNPAAYRGFLLQDYYSHYKRKGEGVPSALQYFKI